jgi:hypothetical protein
VRVAIGARYYLEELAGHVVGYAGASRRHVDLVGIGFGLSDELRDRLGRERWIHHMTFGTRIAAAIGTMSRMKLKLSLS